MLTVREVLKIRGCGRTKLYGDIARGLYMSFVKTGPRSRRCPEDEALEMQAAEIAEEPEEQRRTLVQNLITARTGSKR